mgnify:CR=1 FL=1
MKITEKMAKIIRDRIANSELNEVFSTDVEQMIADAIKKIESIPAKNIEEARLMMEGEKAKLQAFGEDSREYGEAFHNIQFLSSVIEIAESSK